MRNLGIGLRHGKIRGENPGFSPPSDVRPGSPAWRRSLRAVGHAEKWLLLFRRDKSTELVGNQVHAGDFAGTYGHNLGSGQGFAFASDLGRDRVIVINARGQLRGGKPTVFAS